MQRMPAVVVGALLLVMIGALVLKGGRRSFVTDATASDAGARDGGDAGILDDPLFALDLEPEGGLRAMPAASSSPDLALLPSGSPKMVRFGVILVQYRGAQGAPPGSRSKDDALSLARSLAEAARVDFRSQV